MTMLGGQLFSDPILNDSKESLHVREGGLRIVVVVHQPVMIMVAFRQNFINCETRLLHNGASMFELAGNFCCCLFEGAVEAVCLLSLRTLPIVCTIPLIGRSENLARPVHDVKIGFVHRRICIRWSAELGILRACGKPK